MELLDDRFQIEMRCGSGASSQVFRARDLETGEQVAIKISYNEDEDQRFSREVELTRLLNHPNAVRFLARGETQEGNPYVALEWIEGVTLAARIAKGPLPWREAVEIAYQAAEGLAALHRLGIVHRDIKPTNIMIGEEAGRPKVKIIDLGVARDLSKASLTRAGSLIGTPHYMAPEMASGSGNPVPATDVYGLCAVLYELLTAKKLFDAEPFWDLLGQVLIAEPLSPRTLEPEIPEQLETLVLRGLAKEADKRFINCEVLAEALKDFCLESSRNPLREACAEAEPEREVPLVRVVLLLVDVKREEHGKKRQSLAQDRARIRARVEARGGQFVALPGRRMLGLFQESSRGTKNLERVLRMGLAMSNEMPARVALMSSKRWGKEGAILGLSKLASLLKKSLHLPGVRVPAGLEQGLRPRYRYFKEGNTCLVSGFEDAYRWAPQTLAGREEALGKVNSFLERASSPVLLISAQDGVGQTALLGRVRQMSQYEGFQVTAVCGHLDWMGEVGSGCLRLLRARLGLDDALSSEEAIRILRHRRKNLRDSELQEEALGIESLALAAQGSLQEPSHEQRLTALIRNVRERNQAEGELLVLLYEAFQSHFPGSDSEGELWLIDDLDAWDACSLEWLSAFVASVREHLRLIASSSRESNPKLVEYFGKLDPEQLKLESIGKDALGLLQKVEPSNERQREQDFRAFGSLWGNLWLLKALNQVNHAHQLNSKSGTAHALFHEIWFSMDARLLHLLQLAAVLGPRGWLRDLRLLSAIREPEQYFSEFVQRGLWKPCRVAGQYAFISSEFWRWTYDLCPHDLRISWHRECANLFASQQGQARFQAVEHYLAAGQRHPAREILLNFSADAHAAQNWRELAHAAMRLHQLDLPPVERAKVRFWRALAHAHCGRLATAQAALQASCNNEALSAAEREQAFELLRELENGL